MRRLRKSKKKHEANRYLQKQTHVWAKYAAITAHLDKYTSAITGDGVGVFSLPTRGIFERLTPHSEPIGLIFTDGSFLVAQEIFEYGYSDDTATEPQICLLESGYHYQRPQDQAFFRYDYHPEVGSSETHPLYHLHATGWKEGAGDLPQAPRFPVSPMTLEDVLELIRVNFFL